MKVLHIIAGLGNGGAEGVLYRLTTADKNNKHIVVSMMDKGVYGERLEKEGIEIFCLDMKRGKITLKGIMKLYSIVRAVCPDVVQTWMYHADLIGGLVSRIAGCQNIFWGIRGPYNKERTILSTKIVIWLCAIFSRVIPKKIISNSQHAIEAHLQTGYSKKRFECIPNGYSIEEYPIDSPESELIRKEIDVDDNQIVLGMVARFDPYKDHESLFKALYLLSQKQLNLICLLVGTGMEKTNQAVLDMVEKYSVDKIVKLMGPRYDIPYVMGAIDAHVLSSAAESFPNVVAEAMLCGTPCITTDVGDAARIVGDNGWVVPASDPNKMAEAIEKAVSLMRDTDKWNQRKLQCRDRIVNTYSLEKMIDSYVRIWSKAANAK